MTDVMVDIETFGVDAGDIILSAAFLEFHMGDGHFRGGTLEVVFDLKESIDLGFNLNAHTLMWWLDQKPELFKKNLKDPMPIDHALHRISNFLKGKNRRIWANSPSMDLVLLKTYYREMHMPVPWSYQAECDVRTLKALRPTVANQVGYVGYKHTPVDDCIHQIKVVRRVINHIGGIPKS